MSSILSRFPLYRIDTSQSQVTQALNTATTYLAYSFVALGSKFLSSFRIRISGVTGTLTNISCELQGQDASGNPSGTAIETVTVTSSLPTGATNFTFTFAGTTQFTDGGLYWFVIKNNTPTPASNNFTVLWTTSCMPLTFGLTQTGGGGYGKAHTTDGTTWITPQNQIGGFLIGFTDTTYSGMIVSSLQGDPTNKIYDTREAGLQFTSPAGATMRVVGVSCHIRKVLSPTGNLTVKLYTGNPPSGAITSASSLIPGNVPTSGASFTFWFPEGSVPISIPASTLVTITMKDTAADDASNYYACQGENLLDTSTEALACLPWNGTARQAIYNGSTWSTSTTIVPNMGLILDPTSPFL